MNRVIKDATVKRYHYACQDRLERHLQGTVPAYNVDRPLKTLKGLILRIRPQMFDIQARAMRTLRNKSNSYTKRNRLLQATLLKTAAPGRPMARGR
ncbi:hypothetical protein CHELA40_10636 [Chelatococcus asaccharovorans]|nr:hypothetical protein CHELA40_10636 [Chelatococcus asaccharovorans]CAH1686369.1 hypothetical protein CHELA17_64972 [Chelatococcus asaccharovorans]